MATTPFPPSGRSRIRITEVDALDVVQLTRDLIACDTMQETGNEAACLEDLASLLRRAGFQAKVERFGDEHANLYAWLLDVPERPALCFAGHIDTVALHEGRWTSAPLDAEERDGRLYGRGACDMKGGVAAMLCAAIKARASLAPGDDLRLHVYGGEEVGCLGSSHMVRTHPGELTPVGAVVVTEPTSLHLSVGHKGALWLRLTTNGRAAHGSMPQFGDNALSKALAAAGRLEGYDIASNVHPHMGASTMTLTTLHSGSGHNSVPDTARFTLDIRMIPGQDPEGIIADIEKLAGKDCLVEVMQCIHPLWTEPGLPWVRRLAALTETAPHLHAQKPPVTQFFTDGAALRLARPDIPIVILGPGEPSMAHQTDEWCAVAQLRRAESLYAEIIADWYQLLNISDV